METLEKAVARLEANEKNIFHQLDEIKSDVKDIQRLTAAVERIASKTDSIDKKVDSLDGRMLCMESEPADDYKYLRRAAAGSVITGIICALLGALLALIIK